MIANELPEEFLLINKLWRLKHVHDGALVGIRVQGSGLGRGKSSVELEVACESGETLFVGVRSVNALKAANFRQGNIVERVDVVGPAEVSRDDARFLAAYEDGSGRPAAAPIEAEVDRLLAEVRGRDLFLLCLKNSYGCDVSVLFSKCGDVSVRRSL